MNFRRPLGSLAVGALLLSAATGAGSQPARAATTPACSVDTVPSAVTFAQRAGGTVIGTTSIGSWGTTACLLQDKLTFAVKPASDRYSPQGAIGAIANNPATKTFNRTLEPGQVLVYSWRWRNWCGARRTYVMQALWDKLPYTTPSQTIKAPSCTDHAQGSSLTTTRPTVATCSRTDYTIGTDLGQPMMGRMISFLDAGLRPKSAPCVLRQVHVSLGVQRQEGTKWTTITRIAGNPGHRTVGALLTHNYGAFSVFWAWANWCGSGSLFRTRATVGTSVAVSTASSHTASCLDSKKRSTLVPNFGHS